MKKCTVILRKDGTIEWLHPPPFPLAVRQVSRQRFSEILPVNPVKRAAFRVLRRLFGETGRVAAWTRSWAVLWRAEILIGPRRGATRTSGIRAVLLDWEENQWAQQVQTK